MVADAAALAAGQALPAAKVLGLVSSAAGEPGAMVCRVSGRLGVPPKGASQDAFAGVQEEGHGWEAGKLGWASSRSKQE